MFNIFRNVATEEDMEALRATRANWRCHNQLDPCHVHPNHAWYINPSIGHKTLQPIFDRIGSGRPAECTIPGACWLQKFTGDFDLLYHQDGMDVMGLVNLAGNNDLCFYKRLPSDPSPTGVRASGVYHFTNITPTLTIHLAPGDVVYWTRDAERAGWMHGSHSTAGKENFLFRW